jgi:hypothetical protein
MWFDGLAWKNIDGSEAVREDAIVDDLLTNEDLFQGAVSISQILCTR